MVLDTNQSMTRTNACDALPLRPAVDKLLSVYFNSMHSQTRKHIVLMVKPSADPCSDPSHWEVSQGGMFYIY